MERYFDMMAMMDMMPKILFILSKKTPEYLRGGKSPSSGANPETEMEVA